MKKLALVRYGEHENGHLNEKGTQVMILTSEQLKSLIQSENACIISAKIPRASESAEILSRHLNVFPVQTFSELYAEEEEGHLPDLDTATKLINSIGEKYDIVIAVVSREYIETLPNHILKSLGVEKTTKTHLSRGEILVLDYDAKNIEYLC
jgi:phosphohistidine phosphatase SixA